MTSSPRPLVHLTPEALTALSRSTLSHYQANAEDFWEGTKDHDVSQNIHALLDAITAAPPWQILDFGCGPGRDLIALKEAGHVPTGLEGAGALC